MNTPAQVLTQKTKIKIVAKRDTSLHETSWDQCVFVTLQHILLLFSCYFNQINTSTSVLMSDDAKITLSCCNGNISGAILIIVKISVCYWQLKFSKVRLEHNNGLQRFCRSKWMPKQLWIIFVAQLQQKLQNDQKTVSMLTVLLFFRCLEFDAA